jgi:hypothetical protein
VSRPQSSTSLTSAGGPTAGKSLAFVDNFDSLSVGQPGSTWAFTSNSYRYRDHNPDDHKLDWNTPAAMTAAGGELTITATPRGDGYWNTGLLTTEPRNDMSQGGNGFRLRPGDFYVIRAAMPTGNTGAWPALWTWLPDAPRGAEVDPFEWHSDNPHLLELGNAMGGLNLDHEDERIAPGRYLWIGILLGDASNDFFVGDALDSLTKVWSDGHGLAGQRPHLIANLSISDGTLHTAPSGNAPIVYKIDTVRVYR